MAVESFLGMPTAFTSLSMCFSLFGIAFIFSFADEYMENQFVEKFFIFNQNLIKELTDDTTVLLANNRNSSKTISSLLNSNNVNQNVSALFPPVSMSIDNSQASNHPNAKLNLNNNSTSSSSSSLNSIISSNSSSLTSLSVMAASASSFVMSKEVTILKLVNAVISANNDIVRIQHMIQNFKKGKNFTQQDLNFIQLENKTNLNLAYLEKILAKKERILIESFNRRERFLAHFFLNFLNVAETDIASKKLSINKWKNLKYPYFSSDLILNNEEYAILLRKNFEEFLSHPNYCAEEDYFDEQVSALTEEMSSLSSYPDLSNNYQDLLEMNHQKIFPNLNSTSNDSKEFVEIVCALSSDDEQFTMATSELEIQLSNDTLSELQCNMNESMAKNEKFETDDEFLVRKQTMRHFRQNMNVVPHSLNRDKTETHLKKNQSQHTNQYQTNNISDNFFDDYGIISHLSSQQHSPSSLQKQQRYVIDDSELNISVDDEKETDDLKRMQLETNYATRQQIKKQSGNLKAKFYSANNDIKLVKDLLALKVTNEFDDYLNQIFELEREIDQLIEWFENIVRDDFEKVADILEKIKAKIVSLKEEVLILPDYEIQPINRMKFKRMNLKYMHYLKESHRDERMFKDSYFSTFSQINADLHKSAEEYNLKIKNYAEVHNHLIFKGNLNDQFSFGFDNSEFFNMIETARGLGFLNLLETSIFRENLEHGIFLVKYYSDTQEEYTLLDLNFLYNDRDKSLYYTKMKNPQFFLYPLLEKLCAKVLGGYQNFKTKLTIGIGLRILFGTKIVRYFSKSLIRSIHHTDLLFRDIISIIRSNVQYYKLVIRGRNNLDGIFVIKDCSEDFLNTSKIKLIYIEPVSTRVYSQHLIDTNYLSQDKNSTLVFDGKNGLWLPFDELLENSLFVGRILISSMLFNWAFQFTIKDSQIQRFDENNVFNFIKAPRLTLDLSKIVFVDNDFSFQSLNLWVDIIQQTHGNNNDIQPLVICFISQSIEATCENGKTVDEQTQNNFEFVHAIDPLYSQERLLSFDVSINVEDNVIFSIVPFVQSLQKCNLIIKLYSDLGEVSIFEN
eukprot:TRINITY_DN3120_c2_g1_i1.p1 TRINITY_DN3120_c2_g1~~TRINITY_DN3120_c2_g1_i1.p1  ORF type:complete len:1106 (-),score=280.21 TRINITY_DN3120_c2_g1_i1:416-3634(-)